MPEIFLFSTTARQALGLTYLVVTGDSFPGVKEPGHEASIKVNMHVAIPLLSHKSSWFGA
jgi:hypothetical protein